MLNMIKGFAAGLAVGVVALLIVYEGVPLIMDGRVDRARADYVALSEYTALQAKLDETNRQLVAARTIQDNYKRQLESDRASAAEREEATNDAIENDDGDSCGVTADDLDWLRNH